MTMKLTLAIALECSQTECKAQLLEGGAVVLAGYTSRVLARGRTIPRQLVALDINPDRPEVVYRWQPCTVRELRGDLVVTDDQYSHLMEATNAPGLEVAPQVGDWVFVSFGYANKWEVADIAVDGRPTHIEYLTNYAFPKIEELYRS